MNKRGQWQVDKVSSEETLSLCSIYYIMGNSIRLSVNESISQDRNGIGIGQVTISRTRRRLPRDLLNINHVRIHPNIFMCSSL